MGQYFIVFKPVSMLDRIKVAVDEGELMRLSVEGSRYEFAAIKTRKKWDKASTTRRKELTGSKT